MNPSLMTKLTSVAVAVVLSVGIADGIATAMARSAEAQIEAAVQNRANFAQTQRAQRNQVRDATPQSAGQRA
jgi:hypothetical protein